MSRAGSMSTMPRPRPIFPDTLTPEASEDIAARMRAVEDAIEAGDGSEDARRHERDEALRRWYAEGVDVRDLVRATSAGGTLKPLTRQHVHRLVRGVQRKIT